MCVCVLVKKKMRVTVFFDVTWCSLIDICLCTDGVLIITHRTTFHHTREGSSDGHDSCAEEGYVSVLKL